MTDVVTLANALKDLTGYERLAAPRLERGRASVVLDATGLSTQQRDALEEQVRTRLAAVPGVSEVRVLVTSERQGRRLLAVASGKGGVGKSTVAANLALALAAAGVRVGLVDADIYGPSQPTLLGVEGTRPEAEGQRLRPVPTPGDVPLLSIGQLVAPGRALAWRGPMASNALSQLLDADWSGSDLLILDLPPGTGDVQLSIIQKHRPTAALIVSTPQDLALLDAARAVDLFRTAGVPVLGLVENMSGYQCPHCGEWSDPFGTGAAAERLELPLLARVPLSLALRDAGTGGERQAFVDLAQHVRRLLEDEGAARDR